MSGSNDSLQGSNYTQRLKDLGLRSPSELISVCDVNPMYGGRIIQDKLWFYSTYRQTGGKSTVPGMFWNKNAGDITKWTVDFDRSKPAFTNRVERMATLRLTWQATPRNKFNGQWSEQYLDSNYGEGGGTGTAPFTTPEATARSCYIPSRQPNASWSSPISGRLLAEAGWGVCPGPVPLHETERQAPTCRGWFRSWNRSASFKPPLARADSPVNQGYLPR